MGGAFRGDDFAVIDRNRPQANTSCMFEQQQSSVPLDEPIQKSRKRFITDEMLTQLETALRDRSSPEGKRLQECLNRRAKQSAALIADIQETERLTAADMMTMIY